MHEHEHDHPSHAHTHVEDLSGSKILWVSLLNATITGAEILGGLLSGSLSLLSDAMHNLSDTLSILLSYIAHRIAKRPTNARKTYGYKRAEILSAFLNALTLSVISILLLFEAFRRFTHPEPIETGLMLIVAVIGLIANLVSVILLEKDSHHNLNIKSSYLHLMADTLSSVGVILGGLAIRFLGWVWIDSVLTFAIAIYILKEGVTLLKTTADILMQTAPELDYPAIRHMIEGFEHVKGLHHVHAWSLDEKNLYFEAHIEFEDLNLSEIQPILSDIEHELMHDFGITHATLQAECGSCTNHEHR